MGELVTQNALRSNIATTYPTNNNRQSLFQWYLRDYLMNIAKLL